MKVEYISQPFPPEGQWLGNQLRALLRGEQGHFDRFIALVAFIKFSGISRLYSALETFRDAGGQSIITAGINHKGTSKQGLQFLREVVDQIFIYYDGSPERRTFHPKIYIFEQKSNRAIVILGSGNLTAGGLFTNYESHIRIELNLSDEPQHDEDRAFFDELLAKCLAFQDTTSPCIQELTDEVFTLLEPVLLDELEGEGESGSGDRTGDEATEPEAEGHTPPHSTGISGLFGRSQLPRAPRPDITLGRRRVAARPGVGAAGSTKTAGAKGHPTPSSATAPPSIGGFWKALSANDVSTTSSPGQIIIPITFRDFFEPLTLTKPPDAGGKGRQWEGSFPVRFTDGTYALTVNARCIVYEPETGHKRPNTECRFTFRNRDILERLRAEDILVFRQSSSTAIMFDVERITPPDPRYSSLRRGGRRYDLLP
ncbi:MAG TPA: hypothetical protein VEY09_12420 [Pyrinomonadaceae bacterium]|nr:hypothetical protein [Pyrinomonadaceae bacterium]